MTVSSKGYALMNNITHHFTTSLSVNFMTSQENVNDKLNNKKLKIRKLICILKKTGWNKILLVSVWVSVLLWVVLVRVWVSVLQHKKRIET